MRFFAVLVLAIALLWHSQYSHAQTDVKSVLATVSQLQKQEKYSEANSILKQLAISESENQRVSLFYGLNLRYQGRYPEAIVELEKAIALDPMSLNGQQATFILAKAQHLGGQDTLALETIEGMKQIHPDSGWLPQAWVLEAEIKGDNVAEAQAKLDKQNAGENAYKALMADFKVNDNTTKTVIAMKKLALQYREYPIELAAKEAAANLLTINNTQESIFAFQDILDKVGRSAPNSRIVQQAYNRLAALSHRLGKNEEALNYYSHSISIDAQDKLSENAELHSAGVYFEILQRRLEKRERTQMQEWKDLRNMLATAKSEATTTKTKVLADLMLIESYLWTGQSAEAVEAGDQFIDTYSSDIILYKKEIATAYSTLARVAKEASNFDDCVVFANSVITLYPTEEFIWKDMDHIQRAFFDKIEALYSLGKNNDAGKALSDFKSRFPDSFYIKAIHDNFQAGIYKFNQERIR